MNFEDRKTPLTDAAKAEYKSSPVYMVNRIFERVERLEQVADELVEELKRVQGPPCGRECDHLDCAALRHHAKLVKEVTGK